MKKILSILAAVLVCTSMSAFSFPKLAQKPQKDTLRVLAIGNSFSVNAVEQHLHEIAAAAGKHIVIGNLFIGGCSLETHYDNVTKDAPNYSYRKIGFDGVRLVFPHTSISKALADENWDVVTFQQCSPCSGKFETYEPYLTELIKYVKARTKKGVKLYFHQTWAYAKDANHSAFPEYNSDQMVMYEAIMEASRKACRKHRLTIIPCGTAMQDLREFLGNDMVTVDGYHLNDIGQYAAACTWFAVLYGQNVPGNRYHPAGFKDEQIRNAQLSSYCAARKPYKVCTK